MLLPYWLLEALFAFFGSSQMSLFTRGTYRVAREVRLRLLQTTVGTNGNGGRRANVCSVSRLLAGIAELYSILE